NPYGKAMWSTAHRVSAPSSSATSHARAIASRELPGPTCGAKKPIFMTQLAPGPLGLALLRESPGAFLDIVGVVQLRHPAGRDVVVDGVVDRQVHPRDHALLGDADADGRTFEDAIRPGPSRVEQRGKGNNLVDQAQVLGLVGIDLRAGQHQ